MADNYHDVIHQLEDFGIKFRPQKDLPLRLDTAKKQTCGLGGKFWYRLSTFKPDAGGEYIVGRYGSYKSGESEKVVVDWTPLKEAERDRMKAEREAKEARAQIERERLSREAAMSARELWDTGSKTGTSPYLQRKGVDGEACRFMADGSIIVPLLRYDRPREDALRGVQRIWGDGRKRFTRDFGKTGSAVRLGDIDGDDNDQVLLFCEGYATGLTIRMATDRQWPVVVTLDCWNLQPVLEIMRGLYPYRPMLICADDDWRTQGNPGRSLASKAAKQTGTGHVLWPVFPAGVERGSKDTDFNDLHQRAGLDAVTRQVTGVLDMMRRHLGGR